MNTEKPTYEQLEKLYEEVCRENEELRAEIDESRASTSTAFSFVCSRISIHAMPLLERAAAPKTWRLLYLGVGQNAQIRRPNQ